MTILRTSNLDQERFAQSVPQVMYKSRNQRIKWKEEPKKKENRGGSFQTKNIYNNRNNYYIGLARLTKFEEHLAKFQWPVHTHLYIAVHSNNKHSATTTTHYFLVILLHTQQNNLSHIFLLCLLTRFNRWINHLLQQIFDLFSNL